MNKYLKAIALATALCAPAIAHADSFNAPTCADWVYEHNGNLGKLSDRFAMQDDIWLDGYLTGIDPHWQYPDWDVSGRVVYRWFTNYCTKHQHDDLTIAAHAFLKSPTKMRIADGD
jgi:hypothetical protein